MSKQKDFEEVESTSEKPGDIKNAAGGVLLLVAVCAVLWLIASFGPKGADWLNIQTRKLTGVGTENVTRVSPPPKSEKKANPEAPESPPEVAITNSEVADKPEPKPVVESQLAEPVMVAPQTVTRAPVTREDSARQQIEDALGGAELIDARYIAFSDDDKKMIAAVKYLKGENPSKFVEIVFTRDEFGWYRSDKEATDGETVIVRLPTTAK